jgi:hypothetical protein
MLCNTKGSFTNQILDYDANVSISKFNYGFNFWFSFINLSFPIFLLTFVQVPTNMSDEELLSVPTRICHFLMRHYISPHGRFHIPNGHMAQFPTLCDYIVQGRAQHVETNKKFKHLWM